MPLWTDLATWWRPTRPRSAAAELLEALHAELRAQAAAGREQLIALVHAAAQGAPAAKVPSPARAEVSHSAPTVTRPL